MSRQGLLLRAGIFAVLGVACGESSTPDTGAQDLGVADVGQDAGAVDTGQSVDTGVVDQGGPAPDIGTADMGSTDTGGFVPPSFGQWVKFEPPGAFCANGTPYKFFVNFSQSSSNVLIFFEGGGACWDYASCTGTGIRSAANRDGIPDDHATALAEFSGLPFSADAIYPLMNADSRVSPMHDWNKVFMPYCTGDVFSGSRTVTYDDPDGVEPSVEFQHVGHQNVLATIDMLNTMFDSIPKMFVSGCSAGGAGAVINYHFLRSGLNVDTGYLLNDSGPIYPGQEMTSRSLPLQQRVRESWNLEPLLDAAPMAMALNADFGALSDVLAQTYPGDRLAHTHFRLDYNYSLYSYERFYEVDGMGNTVILGDGSGLGPLGLNEDVPEDRTAVYRMWWDDTALLRAQYDAQPNLGYFMPFYRDTNSSHCVTIPGIEEFPPDEVFNLFVNNFAQLAWAGTELDSGGQDINLRDYAAHLLDDATPLQSYFEETGEGRFLSCTPDPMYFDEMACSMAQ